MNCRCLNFWRLIIRVEQQFISKTCCQQASFNFFNQIFLESLDFCLSSDSWELLCSLLVSNHLFPITMSFILSSASPFSFFIILMKAMLVMFDMLSMNFSDQASSYWMLYFDDFNVICLKACGSLILVSDFDSFINDIKLLECIVFLYFKIASMLNANYLLYQKVNDYFF